MDNIRKTSTEEVEQTAETEFDAWENALANDPEVERISREMAKLIKSDLEAIGRSRYR